MQNKFDLKNATILEKGFKKTNNLRGLADLNIELFEKHSRLDRLVKVAFYLARMEEIEEWHYFVKRNEILITKLSFTEIDLIILLRKCIMFGLHYEGLSYTEIEEIKSYFELPSHSELFIDMMYDYKNYVGEIKNLGIDQINVRNKKYSNQLITEVSKYMQFNKNETYYYDRSNNSVCFFEHFNSSIRGIHFPIVPYKRMDESVKLILNSLDFYDDKIYESVIKTLIGKNFNKNENASGWGFSSWQVEKIIALIIHERQLPESEKEILIKKSFNVLALDFLNSINNMKY